jgi:hypothetical protein
VMLRASKESALQSPSRYTASVSQSADSRFAPSWTNAGDDFAGYLGRQIHARTRQPVGIICMQTGVAKGEENPRLKSWIPSNALQEAPTLMDDYQKRASVVPGNQYYDANARRYVDAWKVYWSDSIPRMIASKSVPDGAGWGSFPRLASDVTTDASQTYNILVHSFTPAGIRGTLFVTSPEMFKEDQGSSFGEQITVLANSWQKRFDSAGAGFFYTVPDQKLAPKITPAGKITGPSTAVTVEVWPSTDPTGQQVIKILDQLVTAVYP